MTPTADDQVPPALSIPESLRAAVSFELTSYSTIAEELADRLFRIGLPEGLANGLAVDCLVRQSCELAMYTVIALDNRPLSREQWIEATGKVFDQTLAARASAAAAFAEARQ